MTNMTRRTMLTGVAAVATLGTSRRSFAQKYRDPGVTDTSIKIGTTMPFSGPASAYSVIGRSDIAYFDMVNEKGGINGRKVELIAPDDAYSPPKTVEAEWSRRKSCFYSTISAPPPTARCRNTSTAGRFRICS